MTASATLNLPMAQELESKYDRFQQLMNDAAQQPVAKSTPIDADLFDVADARVFTRVRPILGAEQQRDGTVIVRTAPGCREAHLLAPKISVTGQASIVPLPFTVDGAFGATDSTEFVYDSACRQLLLMAAGGASTAIIAYGQTGSGKTFTTSGLVRCMALDIADALPSMAVSVCVVELQGDECRDLLTGNPVMVLENTEGVVELQGAAVCDIQSGDHFADVIAQAAAARATKSTQRNDASSRSHMITRIKFAFRDAPWALPGILNVADLAGSESTADSATHDKERLQETKFINTSLMTLKDCIRNRAMYTGEKHVHIPFRQSKLTLILKDSFELAVRRQTKTAVIACVSPLLRDVRHTLNTLRYAAMLQVTPTSQIMAIDPDDPTNWTREASLSFIAKVTRNQIDPVVVLPEGDGRAMTQLPEVVMVNRLTSTGSIQPKAAQVMYLQMWKLVVDARTRRRKAVLKPKPEAFSNHQQPAAAGAPKLKR